MTAFNGAEGYGAVTTTGGAGGTVYYVTNLNNSGTGSLRAALEASGARTVLFKLGGTISVSTPIIVSSGDLTIAGQSAPSDSGGITLKNSGTLTEAPLWIKASNIIIRHIRFRPGPSTTQQTVDACMFGTNIGPISDIIIDHCSFSWSVDECMGTGGIISDVTYQWCIFGEALNNSNHPKNRDHSMGILIHHESSNITLHHCLFAHCRDRTPRIKVNGIVAVVNNVIYNPEIVSSGWGPSHTSDEYGNTYVDYVSNYIKMGANSGTAGHYHSWTQVAGNTIEIYIGSGNVLKSKTGGSTSVVLQRSTAKNVGTRASSALSSETDADTAFTEVLAGAGCTVPIRDSVDDRVVENTTNGTGGWVDDPADVGGWPTLAAGTSYTDSNNDGIPNNSSYTNLVSYLDFLAGNPNTSGGGGGDPTPTTANASDNDLHIARIMALLRSGGVNIPAFRFGVGEAPLGVMAVGRYSSDNRKKRKLGQGMGLGSRIGL